MIQIWLIVVSFLVSSVVAAQENYTDTASLMALYDRSIDFAEERADSLIINANIIEAAAEKLQFRNGIILSNRLRGLAEEFAGNYEDAIGYYLRTLRDARKAGQIDYEIAALSDLAIAYSEVKQYEKARDIYKQSLQLSLQRGEVSSIINGYGNLGAIYNLLNQPDSALLVLEEAVRLCKQYNAVDPLSSIYNNLGNVFFKKKAYQKALAYFTSNRLLHAEPGDEANLWTDYLNIGDVYLEMGRVDSARFYAREALRIAEGFHSKRKEAESYKLMAKLEERSGRYQAALDYQRKWYQLDTALVNQESASAIAELQERYNARDREKQNELLQVAVEREQLKNSRLQLIIFGVILAVLLISILFWTVRQSNKKLKRVNSVIQKQKETLTELNREKNELISIVSHDLSTPFSSIQLWSRILEEDQKLGPNELKAAANIRKAAETGETMIRRILDIEKQATGTVPLELEEVRVDAFVAYIADLFKARASEKNIRLSVKPPDAPAFVLTDQSILQRIVENLLSNAIKFSEPHTEINVLVEQKADTVAIHIDDEGPGISPTEQQQLFTRYAQLSPVPTAGEISNGLGLSIVKRLANELNANILYKKLQDRGSRFSVVLKA